MHSGKFHEVIKDGGYIHLILHALNSFFIMYTRGKVTLANEKLLLSWK